MQAMGRHSNEKQQDIRNNFQGITHLSNESIALLTNSLLHAIISMAMGSLLSKLAFTRCCCRESWNDGFCCSNTYSLVMISLSSSFSSSLSCTSWLISLMSWYRIWVRFCKTAKIQRNKLLRAWRSSAGSLCKCNLNNILKFA